MRSSFTDSCQRLYVQDVWVGASSGCSIVSLYKPPWMSHEYLELAN